MDQRGRRGKSSGHSREVGAALNHRYGKGVGNPHGVSNRVAAATAGGVPSEFQLSYSGLPSSRSDSGSCQSSFGLIESSPGGCGESAAIKKTYWRRWPRKKN